MDAEAKSVFNNIADASDEIVDDLGIDEPAPRGRKRAPEPEPEPEPEEEPEFEEEEKPDNPKEHRQWVLKTLALKSPNNSIREKWTGDFIKKIDATDPSELTVKQMKALNTEMHIQCAAYDANLTIAAFLAMFCNAVEAGSKAVGMDVPTFSKRMDPTNKANPAAPVIKGLLEESVIDNAHRLDAFKSPAVRLTMFAFKQWGDAYQYGCDLKEAQEQQLKIAAAAAPKPAAPSAARGDNIEEQLSKLPTDDVTKH
jgi:hypothetical protein